MSNSAEYNRQYYQTHSRLRTKRVVLREHLEKALECLTDEFNVGRAGPSGLRAQAIAHVRTALSVLSAPEARE